jgi:hypothetical protein
MGARRNIRLDMLQPALQKFLQHQLRRFNIDAGIHFGCVDVEQEAEGKVSDDEYFYLQHNTKDAFSNMMLFSRCVILARPTTRRGLIHQVRYLASQFNDLVGCKQGRMYLPDDIGEKPWPMAFLQSLAAGVRKMGGGLDAPKVGGRQ